MKNETKLNQDAIELLRKAPKFKDAAEQSKVMRELADEYISEGNKLSDIPDQD